MLSEQTKISPKYKISDWIELRKALMVDDVNGQWENAIEVLDDRLKSRFFEPVDRLRSATESADLGFGFAMLTLDCLLIDTIESFREGRIKGSETSTAAAFRHFFRSSETLSTEFSNALVGKFYDAIRCGLMHDGETRKGWRVWRRHDSKTIEHSTDGYVLYRDNFHDAIVTEFNRYKRDLLSADSSSLRESFLKRMDAICGLADNTPVAVEYFAYGSNMNPNRMFDRIKSAIPIGIARLDRYRLVFNKQSSDGTAKANIERSNQSDDFVLGCVYLIPESDFDKLRPFEKGYFDVIVEVDKSGVRVLAYTFIAEAGSVVSGRPSTDYLSHILKGAKYLDLPDEYQASLLKYSGESN